MKKLISRGTRILFIVIALMAALLILPYSLAYKGKIIPGVTLKNINLGNRSEASSAVLVRNYLSLHDGYPITLLSGGLKIKISQEELGITYDPQATLQEAQQVGRKGTLFERCYKIYTAWFKGVQIKPALKINHQKFSRTLSGIKKNIETKAVEASFVWQQNELIITPSSSGNLVKEDGLSAQILKGFEEIDFEPVVIPVRTIEPEIKERDLEFIKSEISNLVRNPPRLKYESKIWIPTPEKILTFLEFKSQTDVAKPKININKETLKDYFLDLANQVNIEAKSGIFNIEKNRVTAFELPEDGKALNIDKAVGLYSDKLLSLNASPDIELPVEITRAQGGGNEYGVRELLGEGITNFKGSDKGRIHNISLASVRLRGVLVPPGETFSFNENLGEVSEETGYDLAYIIKERKTVLGPGGGVCQVSTTLFRAAFNAGLPIVERYPHAYRVHYYEPPVGFDASVYAPYTDLKFKNDTWAYILIFSYFLPEKYTLTFKIFGTKDGREVKIEGPVIESTTPPPEPLYQEDATLAPGETKQVDFSAAGAKVTVKRTVIRNGETLINETLRSVYSPWQAVYLVGVEE